MRVLVCGGRDYDEEAVVNAMLDNLGSYGADPKSLLIIHGGARGADTLADLWAERNGVEREVYFADWDAHGRSAGHIRNARMLKEGKPDLVVAFRGGPGTRSMCDMAKKAGVRVICVGWWPLTTRQ
jgi:hypothetical protein